MCDLMQTTPDRRTLKRLATRQGISDAATRLFWERGFENVTVDEIAAAAGVGRMTVFNYFPRKEDMFFDREDEGKSLMREALRQRSPDVSPLEALRLLAHRLVAERAPYLAFSPASQSFMRTIEGSPTLKARARAIRDEMAQEVAEALSESIGRRPDDPDVQLAAGQILAIWTVAFIQAHNCFNNEASPEAAQKIFLDLVDKGMRGLKAGMAGTPYV